MKKLQSSLGVKLFSFNTKTELISKIKLLAKERNVSQSYLITDIFTTYFELINEFTEVSNEN